MKIVIGVDDSKNSQRAIQYVKQMKWPDGTNVIVVSAVRELVPVYSEVYAAASLYSEQLMEDLLKAHQEIAAAAAKELAGAGFVTESQVHLGDPRAVVVDVARSEHADLVVVGSHGHTGIAKVLLGSVASHIVSHAPCSVLVVKVQTS